MDGNRLVTRCGGLVEADVDGELVALHIDKGSCYGFNATATEIWTLIERPQTVDALCDTLMRRHVVDRDTCLADVSRVLETLSTEGLVTVSRVS